MLEDEYKGFELGDAVEFFPENSDIKIKGCIIRFMRGGKAIVNQYIYNEDKNKKHVVDCGKLNYQ